MYIILCCISQKKRNKDLSFIDIAPSNCRQFLASIHGILDGNSEIVRPLGPIYVTWSIRHLITSRAITIRIVFLRKKDLFSFMRAQHVLSYHLINVQCVHQKKALQIFGERFCTFTIAVGARVCICRNSSNQSRFSKKTGLKDYIESPPRSLDIQRKQ